MSSIKAQLDKLNAKIKRDQDKANQLKVQLQQEEAKFKNNPNGKKKKNSDHIHYFKKPVQAQLFNHNNHNNHDNQDNKEEEKEHKQQEEKTREWFGDLSIYTNEIDESDSKAEVVNGHTFLGLPHLKTTTYNPIAHKYWQEEIAHYEIELDSGTTLSTLYPKNKVIKVWDGGNHTPEFQQFITNCYGSLNKIDLIKEGQERNLTGGRFARTLYSIWYKITYIKVNAFSLKLNGFEDNMAYFSKVKQGKGNDHDSKDSKDSEDSNDSKNKMYDEPKLYHPHISYKYEFNIAETDLRKIFLPHHSPYVQENYIPNACGLTMILNKIKPSWDAHYAKQKNPAHPSLTYQSLHKLLQLPLNTYSVSPEILIDNFFVPFKLQLRLYDRDLLPLDGCSHIPEKRNKNINGAVKAIFTDGHFYELNHDLPKLAQLQHDEEEINVNKLTVSNHFYIPKVEEHKQLTNLCKKMGMPKQKGIISKVEMIKFLESKDVNIDHIFFSDRIYKWLPDIDMWKDIDFSQIPSTVHVPEKELHNFLHKHNTLLLQADYAELLTTAIQMGFTIPRGKDYSLLTPIPLNHLNQYLIHTINIIPKVIYRGNSMSALLLKIGEVRVRFVNPPLIEVQINGITKYDYLRYDNQEQVEEFNRLHRKMSEALMNKANLSRRFVDDPIQLKDYAPKALTGKICDAIHNTLKATHHEDISKAYTWGMLNLHHFSITGSFDRWHLSSNITDIKLFNKYYYYMVERTVPLAALSPSNKIVLAYKYTIYSGFLLTYPLDKENDLTLWSRIAPYSQVIGYMTVSGHTSPSKLRKVIKEIANSPILTTDQKKKIWVENVGMIERTENRKQEVRFYKIKEEAIHFAQKIKGSCFKVETDGALEYMKLHRKHKFYYANNDPNDPNKPIPAYNQFDPTPGHEQYPDTYMVRVKVTTDLHNGFIPIKVDIYGLNRIRAMLLCDHVTTIGIPLAIQTDAIYFKPHDPDLSDDIKNPNIFQSIGDFVTTKLLPKQIVPSNALGDPTKDKPPTFLEHKKIQNFELQNEHQWKTKPKLFLQEAFDILDKQLKKGNGMILGTLAGTGKTYLAKEYALYRTKKGDKVKSMALANKRVKDLIKNGLDASTIHSAFKMRLDEDSKTIDPDDVDTTGIDLMFIDEVYLLQVGAYATLRKIHKENKVRMIFTGDVDQQKIVEFKVDNVDEYYREIVESFVSFSVTLRINKRMKTPLDQQRYQDLKAILRDNIDNIPIPDYLNVCPKIETLFPLMIVENKYKGQILCYHQDTVYKINQIFHNEILKHVDMEVYTVKDKKLFVGLELIKKGNRAFSDQMLYTNFSYIITRIDKDKRIKRKGSPANIGAIYIVPIELLDENTNIADTIFLNEIEIPFNATVDFAYPYATTMMSSQGDTYDDVPIAIFDIDSHYCGWQSIHTSIGRTNELKNIYLYLGESFRINQQRLETIITTRITQHKAEDKKRKREFTEEEYVDIEWVLKTMKDSKLCCTYCRYPYNFFEADSKNRFSIERRENNIAHIKTNCVIYCRGCNESHVKLI